VLRVDRKFRTHGPEEERVKYHMRPAVEAAYAFLKTQYGMAVNKGQEAEKRSCVRALQRSLPCADEGGGGEHREAG